MLIGWVFLYVCGRVDAEALTKWTGYTRPGTRKEADAKEQWIGATVYFQVYDRAGGKEGDPWDTGIKDIEGYFVSGRRSGKEDSTSRLDTTARYLYLYQVMNDADQGRNLASVTITLESQRVTSFGKFVDLESKYKRGVGFAVALTDGKPEQAIRPISTKWKPFAKEKFAHPAPAILVRNKYYTRPIQLGNKIVPAAEGEDVGRHPEEVILGWREKKALPKKEIEDKGAGAGKGRDSDRYLVRYELDQNLVAKQTGSEKKAPTDQILDSTNNLVAVWDDSPLKPGDRSTLFGFTSNAPPRETPVQIRGTTLVNPDEPGDLVVNGSVPTPGLQDTDGSSSDWASGLRSNSDSGATSGLTGSSGGLAGLTSQFGNPTGGLGGAGGFGGSGNGNGTGTPAFPNGTPNGGGGTPDPGGKNPPPPPPPPPPKPVPEPSSLILASGMGACLLFWHLRSCRKHRLASTSGV